MSHIGCKDDDWANANIYQTPEDYFHCKACDISFALESDKIKGKNIICPICMKNLKPWRTRVMDGI